MIEQRKKDHVKICLDEQVQYKNEAQFDQFQLKHCALPEINFSEVSLKTSFLGYDFDAPFFISSMTGGYANGGLINKQLARIAAELNIPMGLGSQRIMVEQPETIPSFSVVRDISKEIFIASNIGGVQLAEWDEAKSLQTNISLIIDSVKANALIVHLNPLQELVQLEGDHNFSGILKGIQSTVEFLEDIPVIVKETGAGISDAVAQSLISVGVKAIDVAGSGGTSWAKVEEKRKPTSMLSTQKVSMSEFGEWGIPTTECLSMISPLKQEYNFALIASGGVYTALDMVKSLALGADLAAFATPLIKKLIQEGEESTIQYLRELFHQMKMALCLCGVKAPSQIQQNHLFKRS